MHKKIGIIGTVGCESILKIVSSTLLLVDLLPKQILLGLFFCLFAADVKLSRADCRLLMLKVRKKHLLVEVFELKFLTLRG